MFKFPRFALLPIMAVALYAPLGMAQEKAQTSGEESCVSRCGVHYDACIKAVRKHSTAANYKVLHPAPAGYSSEIDRFAFAGCQDQQARCENLCGGSR
jgi:hypothetical protein